MTISTRKLKQIATYWKASGVDQYNTRSYDAPVDILCRWETKTDIVKNSKGEEVISTSLVFVDRIIFQEDFLALGAVTGSTPALPVDDETAFPVIRIDEMPNIRAFGELVSVRL